jgi:hypothetical protein
MLKKATNSEEAGAAANAFVGGYEDLDAKRRK